MEKGYHFNITIPCIRDMSLKRATARTSNNSKHYLQNMTAVKEMAQLFDLEKADIL